MSALIAIGATLAGGGYAMACCQYFNGPSGSNRPVKTMLAGFAVGALLMAATPQRPVDPQTVSAPTPEGLAPS